mgnify:CR=1 FL=1
MYFIGSSFADVVFVDDCIGVVIAATDATVVAGCSRLILEKASEFSLFLYCRG